MRVFINTRFKETGSKPWKGGKCRIFERRKTGAKLFVTYFKDIVEVALYLYGVNVLTTRPSDSSLIKVRKTTAGIGVRVDGRFRERPIKGRQEGMNKFMKRTKASKSHVYVGQYISTVYISGHFHGIKKLVVGRTSTSIVKVQYN